MTLDVVVVALAVAAALAVIDVVVAGDETEA